MPREQRLLVGLRVGLSHADVVPFPFLPQKHVLPDILWPVRGPVRGPPARPECPLLPPAGKHLDFRLEGEGLGGHGAGDPETPASSLCPPPAQGGGQLRLGWPNVGSGGMSREPHPSTVFIGHFAHCPLWEHLPHAPGA